MKMMSMNPDYKAKYLTLDWDNISIDEAHKRCDNILEMFSNIRRLVLSLSPTKGFHVRVYCYSNTNVAMMRRTLKDDGRRLVHDLLNRPGDIHDILWDRKIVSGITWEAQKIKTYDRLSRV